MILDGRLVFGIQLARHGANTSDLFPEQRNGSLDGENLQKLVLTAIKVRNAVGFPDAIFFRQIILPICDTSKPGVENDGRFNYYDDVQMLSVLYQISNKLGETYGHRLPLPIVDEFVKFDGVVIRDAIHGQGEGTIYRRWRNGACGNALIKKDNYSCYMA